jgi:hypothetical protein
MISLLYYWNDICQHEFETECAVLGGLRCRGSGMSDEFDSLDEREKAAVEGALDRCRVIADQIAITLRNVSPEQFADKLSLADFHTSLERAADALGQRGRKSDPTVKYSQARGRRRHRY